MLCFALLCSIFRLLVRGSLYILRVHICIYRFIQLIGGVSQQTMMLVYYTRHVPCLLFMIRPFGSDACVTACWCWSVGVQEREEQEREKEMWGIVCTCIIQRTRSGCYVAAVVHVHNMIHAGTGRTEACQPTRLRCWGVVSTVSEVHCCLYDIISWLPFPSKQKN